MNPNKKKWTSISFLVCGMGFGVLIYSIRVITVGGLNADANHVGGDISGMGVAGILAGFILVIGSMIYLSRTIKHSDASEASSIALWTLVSSLASLFVYLFIIPTIALGVINISKSRYSKARITPIAISVLAILASIIGVATTFATS